MKPKLIPNISDTKLISKMYMFDIRYATVITVVFDPVIEHLTQNATCFFLFSNVARVQ